MRRNLHYIENDLTQKGNDPRAKLNVLIDYAIGIIDYEFQNMVNLILKKENL